MITQETLYLRETTRGIGRDRTTGEDHWLDVVDHASLVVAGQTGSGKSNVLNVLIAGMLHNWEAYERIDLVDLKYGVEFGMLEGVRPNISLVTEYEELPALLRELNTLIKERSLAMRGKEKRWSGKTRLVMFDEMATLTHVPLVTREAKAENAQLVADIASVLMKGRSAGVKVVAATQRPHADDIPSSIRFNMGARMCGKVFERSVIANVFGDAQELDDIRPADFPPGCFYSDLGDGQRRLIQVPRIADDIREVLSLQTSSSV